MAYIATEQAQQLITAILQPWQLSYFREFQKNSRLLTCAARQIGKSFVASFCTLYDVIVNCARWTIVSTGQRAADEIFKKCVKMTRYFEGMTRGTKLHFGYLNTASEIRFSNGGLITSCPNNPDGLRGFSSSLLFDEMAFIDNAEECWAACIPFLTSPFGATKKLQIFSTPAGQSGLFYRLWNESDFIKTKVTILDAVRDGLPVNIPELRKTVIDDDIWRQEFLCEFLDTNSSLFSYDLLNGMKWDSLPNSGFSYYLGIDIGRTSDLTVIAVMIKCGDKFYVKDIIVLKDCEYDKQFKEICTVIDALHPRKVCIDATGIGNNLGENLKKKYPSIVNPIVFNNSNKNEMYGDAKQMMGTQRLFLPNDSVLVDEFHSIRRVVSSNGSMSYSAPRENGSHADRATACILALNAANSKKTPAFMPISG